MGLPASILVCDRQKGPSHWRRAAGV